MNGTKGYILISRKIVESKIWDKPPLYIKLWLWLLTQANYGEHNGLKRGQILTSYSEIAEALSWHVGYRKMTPKKDEIYKILRFMSAKHESVTKADNESVTKATMIATTKATSGVLIDICNFNDYQDFKFYESDNESDNESEAKADNEREAKENLHIISKTNKQIKTKNRGFTPPSIDEVREYCLSRNNHVDAEAFIDFYASKGWMIGKNKMKDWKAAVRTWERKQHEKHNGVASNTQPKRTGIDWDALTANG